MAGFAPALAALSTPCLCCWATRAMLVDPEVVATSPCRIKSPVPVCCGFESAGSRDGSRTRWVRLERPVARAALRSRLSARSVTLRGLALIECDSAYKADGSL